MNLPSKTLMVFTSIMALFFAVSPVFGEQNKFKLKTGARGEICLTCHGAFKEKMKKAFIHTPLKQGECSGCHNPHTSDYGALMAAPPGRICYTCHESVAPAGAASIHKMVAEGNCNLCHDPHAADNRYNLVKAGSELCFGCHKELAQQVGAAKFKHAPAANDCLSCHNPHSSAKMANLLKDEPPALCLKCHQVDKPGFAAKHLNYPVAKANCTSCHNPHGSSSASLLYDKVHQPVAKKMCNQCHVEANSPNPFALNKEGAELCQGCHKEVLAEAFGKKRLHWPLADRTGCINCHNPHGSMQPGLLKGSLVSVCGRCHADTVARQERSQTKHPPVAEGQCAECHEPHGSDEIFLLNQASILTVCGTCHEWQSHSTHPIGEKVVDPRNKNLTVQCLSCHRAHGTEHPHFIYFETVQDLCVQCHIQYRR